MDLQNIIFNAIFCFFNSFYIFVHTNVVSTIYEQAINKRNGDKPFEEWI